MFTWAVLSCAVACITEFHDKSLVVPKNGKMSERKVKVCVYKREGGDRDYANLCQAPRHQYVINFE